MKRGMRVARKSTKGIDFLDDGYTSPRNSTINDRTMKSNNKGTPKDSKGFSYAVESEISPKSTLKFIII